MRPRRHRTPREQLDAVRRARDKRWRRQQRNLLLEQRAHWRAAAARVWSQHHHVRRLQAMTGKEVFDLLAATAVV